MHKPTSIACVATNLFSKLVWHVQDHGLLLHQTKCRKRLHTEVSFLTCSDLCQQKWPGSARHEQRWVGQHEHINNVVTTLLFSQLVIKLKQACQQWWTWLLYIDILCPLFPLRHLNSNNTFFYSMNTKKVVFHNVVAYILATLQPPLWCFVCLSCINDILWN